MAFLLIAPTMNTSSWQKHILKNDPEIDLRVWPDTKTKEEIRFALAWNHPRGIFSEFPNLSCIASMGAGVDHIVSDPDIDEGIYITRIVHPSMPRAMSEYVILAVLNYCRGFHRIIKNMEKRAWKPFVPRAAEKTRIGIMGFGQLGKDAAEKLNALGFPVAAWKATSEPHKNIEIFVGDDRLEAFLNRTDLLVCMLPLTPKTRGILNKRTLSALPRGAYLVNIARGGHLVEEDLLELLDKEHLSGACLDVFEKEPLPPDHPFWSHPGVIVTPHISSLTNPKEVVPRIVENYHRVMRGEKPFDLVNRKRMY